MKTTHLLGMTFAASLLFVAACGDDGDKKKTPDAGMQIDAGPDIDAPDAPPACDSIALGTGDQDLVASSATSLRWSGPVMINGAMGFVQVEFYGAPQAAGTVDLTAGPNANYATCTTCILAATLDANGDPDKIFFQNGGTLNLTEDPFTNQHLLGALATVTLEEVTIAQDATSTPVVGGTCVSLGSAALDWDKVPQTYTCATNTYDDATACNCICGAPDPDCATSVVTTVTGCAANQACNNASACVTPPANDRCEGAIALTIGTPVNGTTVDSVSQFDAGLEAMTCTTYSQAGPDVVYKVTLAAAQSINVNLTNVLPNTAMTGFDPSLSIIGPGTPAAACNVSPVTCTKGADVGVEGDPETITAFVAPTAGVYYIIVDSFYAARPGGTFTLNVTTN